MKRLIDVIILFWVLINCLISVIQTQEVTQSCLQCICKASSGCNLKTKCHNSGSNAYFCGPYQISWAYWADAGKPGNTGRSDDFEVCLNDKNCAEVAVRGYMAKERRDCNNDGVIDCLDFAAIHKAGASSCDQQWLYNSQYWNVFRQCQISAGDASAQPPLNEDPWPQSQPQNNPRPQLYPQPQPQPQAYPNGPYPQPRPRPSLKPVPQPQPSDAYNPPESDPWNQPQPQPALKPQNQPQPQPDPYNQPQPDPYNQPQPVNDDPWNQPQPRPALKPQNQPQPDTYNQPQPDTYNQPQPQPDPYNQPQPATDDPWNQPQPDPQPQPPQPQPYPSDPYVGSQPQSRPTLKPQTQPQPNDYNQPPNYDSWDQPNQPPLNQPDDAIIQPYPADPYNPSSQPGEADPWDEVSRAVDELSRPTLKPQTQPQPQGNPNSWNADPPSAQPQPAAIPGRAPVQPVSWGTTRAPTNSFGQPFRPTLNPNNPNPNEQPPNLQEVPINGSVDANCLECICQASSDCDLNKQCEGSYCGPYLISWGYWSDAGQPGGNYATCANNKACAQQAVQGYMNKWQKDCNGDGVIDCTDFAAIHKLGPHSCNSEAIQGTDYWNSYESCKSPAIDARRLPTNGNPPTNAALTGRSVSQSVPSANLFQEYPNPIYSNPKPINTNPGTRNPSDSYTRGSIVRFPSENTNRGQPNGYGGTSGIGIRPQTSPQVVGQIPPFNGTNERAFQELGLNRECLECICQASSRCDSGIGCQNDGSGGYLCGPYQMSWSHWSDAGKPGIGGNLENLENFQSCLNNKDCAEATLFGYITKWKRDCNEDQNINCYDFAALHMAGPSNCNAQWFLESQYWADFHECFDFRRRK